VSKLVVGLHFDGIEPSASVTMETVSDTKAEQVECRFPFLSVCAHMSKDLVFFTEMPFRKPYVRCEMGDTCLHITGKAINGASTRLTGRWELLFLEGWAQKEGISARK
jgi:hypothetical protein